MEAQDLNVCRWCAVRAAEWGIGSRGARGAHPLPLLDSSSRHRQALFHPFLLSLPHILCSGLRPGTPWGVSRS